MKDKMKHPRHLLYGNALDDDYPLILVIGREPNCDEMVGNGVGAFWTEKTPTCQFWDKTHEMLGALAEPPFVKCNFKLACQRAEASPVVFADALPMGISGRYPKKNQRRKKILSKVGPSLGEHIKGIFECSKIQERVQLVLLSGLTTQSCKDAFREPLGLIQKECRDRKIPWVELPRQIGNRWMQIDLKCLAAADNGEVREKAQEILRSFLLKKDAILSEEDQLKTPNNVTAPPVVEESEQEKKVMPNDFDGTELEAYFDHFLQTEKWQQRVGKFEIQRACRQLLDGYARREPEITEEYWGVLVDKREDIAASNYGLLAKIYKEIAETLPEEISGKWSPAMRIMASLYPEYFVCIWTGNRGNRGGHEKLAELLVGSEQRNTRIKDRGLNRTGAKWVGFHQIIIEELQAKIPELKRSIALRAVFPWYLCEQLGL